MPEYIVTPEVALTHSPDMPTRISRFPASYTIKGMFFSRIVSRLGASWGELQRTLVAPPRLGRYLPFSDYPQSDYGRVVAFACTKLHPRLAGAEGLRLIARTDVDAFTSSTVGRVVMAAIRDPSGALLRLPEIYGMIVHGGDVKAEPLDGGGVRLAFKEWYASLDSYTLGTIEGLVLHYGAKPTMTLRLASDIQGTFEVRWK